MKVTSETQETGPHFLLIVGPSGSGKSTFIRMLKTGSLEKSIFELLPNNCQDWPTVEGNEIFKGKTTTKKILEVIKPSNSAIIHYDIAMIHRHGFQDYKVDPVFELLSLSSKVSIIEIQIDHASLIHQHQGRELQHEVSKKPQSNFWKKNIRLPLRRIKHYFQNKLVIDTIVMYNTDNFVKICYDNWDNFTNIINYHQRIKIRPQLLKNGQFNFKIQLIN